MSGPEITVRFELPKRVSQILYHTLSLLENHFYLQLKEHPQGNVLISDSAEADIRISQKFIEAIINRQFDQHLLMHKQPVILSSDGAPDLLGTCAYMVNFLQEYDDNPDHFDHLLRFKYEKSYQHRFDCITENLVLRYLLQLQEECSKLQDLERKKLPSQLWVSHDIDYLYHNRIPDLKTAIRHFSLKEVFQVISKTFQDPDEEIFDKILSINQANGLQATFFWLASKRTYMSEHEGPIENANYSIHSPKVRMLMQKITSAGFELGVHQSLGCRDLVSEKNSIDPGISINRNHYLAGKLPELWRSLDQANIPRDASAGFSNAMGFRNSYGWPVQPFDLQRQQPFKVTEYPLHIMDATFLNLHLGPHETFSQITSFLDNHSSDCQLSLLWHNNYFSEIKFKEWIE
ncbi:MAG: hypothetical protein HKN76_04570, partial [Saprospiraceae bacterium]|nr:hypothetical protein [Saprospiraceae bacterium]